MPMGNPFTEVCIVISGQMARKKHVSFQITPMRNTTGGPFPHFHPGKYFLTILKVSIQEYIDGSKLH